MRDFLKSLLASMVALALFSGAALLLFFVFMAAMTPAAPTVPDRAVLVLDLSQPIPDAAQDGGPQEALQRALSGGGEAGTPLPLLLNTLERAAKDKHIAALYLTGNVQSSGYASGPAALKELREALQRFKQESGKPVVAYNEAYGKSDLYLCGGASTVYLHPSGEVDVTGLAAEPMFFGGLFKKYGVEVQVTRVGKFKSAVEPYILEKMSDANREQMQSFLGDIWSEWKAGVAADRKKLPEDLQTLADQKGTLLSQEALQAGLVDKLANPDEVLDELKRLSGKQAKDREFPQITLETYAKIGGDSSKGRNRIAVVYAEGDIVDGEGDGNQVGGERLSRELRRLRLDTSIKAVVLRVNSPGGSAIASELIQREVILTKAVKPVVVSMGYLAASGGYWISTYGSRIFAEPNTITGSIGVFGMMPNVKKLANEHGLTWDNVQTARLASPGIGRPRTADELARIQVLVDDVYDQFLRRVSDSRKMTKEAVHEVAQGRVWSGQAALKLGLVDEMGGLKDAIRHAAKLAKIENDYRVDTPDPAKQGLEKVLSLLGDKDKRKLTRTGLAGDVKNEFDRVFRALSALNDPRGIYARMPMDLVIR